MADTLVGMGVDGRADVTIRRVRPGEEERYVRSVMIPFLDPYTGEGHQAALMERMLRRIEFARCWVVEDGGRFVGNCAVRTMDVTVPGSAGGPCPTVPMGGVTSVGVHPTHRRQGLLARMMGAMLDDCRERGEPLAGLIASESAIYGRFGFGPATDLATYSIDRHRARMQVPPAPARLDLLDRDEAAKVLPDLFERQRRTRPGEVIRTDGFWEEYFVDSPRHERHAGSALFFAVGEDGYAAYRATQGDGDGLETLVVEELRGTTPEAEAALWQFVLGVDLVGTVKVRRRPLVEPVRWRLADPRQLRLVESEDFLHLRILDLPAAVAARSWSSADRLVLDVGPPPAPVGGPDPVPGRWVIEAGPDGAECRPAGDRAPDLALDVTALGALYLGGHPASLLAAAGRITELTPGAALRADRLFATWPAPLNGTGF